ncbi:MAG: hypothetical protein FWD33_00675 [Alphaproteobacteria bacterium]|nr:hypothetical protein [Alphaproteobacteria bacterium]
MSIDFKIETSGEEYCTRQIFDKIKVPTGIYHISGRHKDIKPFHIYRGKFVYHNDKEESDLIIAEIRNLVVGKAVKSIIGHGQDEDKAWQKIKGTIYLNLGIDYNFDSFGRPFIITEKGKPEIKQLSDDIATAYTETIHKVIRHPGPFSFEHSEELYLSIISCNGKDLRTVEDSTDKVMIKNIANIKDALQH